MQDSSTFNSKLKNFSLTMRVINWQDVSSVGRLLAHALDLKSHLPENRRGQLEPLIGTLVDELNTLILGTQDNTEHCLEKSGLLLKAAGIKGN